MNTMIFRIEIALVDLKPVVRRVVEVPGEATMAVLHEVVQDAVGWERAHLHEFDRAGKRYGIWDPEWDPEAVDESMVTLSDLVGTGEQIGYLYDFGDSWEHVLTVESVTTAQPGVRYPRCVAGEGACPPEDVGGVVGYQYFLDAITDPSHPEHAERAEWWGCAQFDPTWFSLEATNWELQRMSWTPLDDPASSS